jgi:hypothetical protein
MSAVGVILLMAGTSAAVVGYFRSRTTEENLWQRAIAPSMATVVLLALVVLLIANFDSLLGTDPTSPLRWIPGLALSRRLRLFGLAVLRRTTDVYQGIGRTATGFVDYTTDAGLNSALR